MKVTVLGFEGSEGIGKTSGKAYAMGQLHVATPLGAPFNEKGISKGAMGSTYRVELELVRRLAQVPVPFAAELDVSDVMRFGKRETMVLDCRPVEHMKKAA